MYEATTALYKILALKKRLKIVQGGSGAGKSIGILLILIDRAQCEDNKVFSIVSESLPHLKRGAIRDFVNIMQTQKYWHDEDWNATDAIYTFPVTNSRIEFFSAQDSDKVHGPRRNDLFINECNNVPFNVYTQLAIRTSGNIYLDYNPVSEFWVHEQLIPNFDHDFIILTYKDNEGLSKAIIEELEMRQNDRNFWTVYGLGQLGTLEGQIYSDWALIDEIPHEARLERIGLDFGFANDPSAGVAVYYYNGGYILDEILFGKRMTNKMIADVLKNQPPVIIAADSAEPKSIEELKTYDLNVIPAPKGPDSIRQGINLVQQQRISLTSKSLNLIKEYRNYAWEKKDSGDLDVVPIGIWNHAMDALRYAFQTMEPASKIEAEKQEKADRLLSRLRNILTKTR